MSRYYSYINSAKEILNYYKGEEPFALFLKKFFSSNKKYGSKDRKQIAHLCYCFFRLGKIEMEIPIEERILQCLFFCSNEQNDILETLKPEWDKKVRLPISEKLATIGIELQSMFPWKDELSQGVEHEKLCESFFVQPDLFLRLRPGKEKIVKEKLQQAGIEFKNISDFCISLGNATKIDSLIELDKEAIVQDYNSQQTSRLFGFALASPQNDKPSIWDCCAGSGGKSIMAYDLNNNIELTVSDIRESILSNLKKRFQTAGIKEYNSFVTDLTKSHLPLAIQNSLFDLIICDAPCTGSGTWGRTPEQLYFFEKGKIDQYSLLQKKIATNVVPYLKKGGYFLYITCSVFRNENEEIAEYIEKDINLRKIELKILKGYDKKADTMFVSLFQKPL